MSAPINDGGPAFPTPYSHPFGDGRTAIGGLSARDWFAGQALVGIMSRQDGDSMECKTKAEWSYRMADAMLAARDKLSAK